MQKRCGSKAAVGMAALGMGVLVLALSGCGSSKCLDCAGENPCPPFFGTYVGNQAGSMDTCGSWYLLEGSSILRVMTQEDNRFEVELQDSQGLWALFKGELCNTNKQDPPRYYHFDATYEINEVGADYQLFYNMNGSFGEADANSAARVDGTLSINLFFPDNPEANCTLSGPFDGVLTE